MGRAEFFSVERPFSYFRFRENRFQELPSLARIFSQARCLGAKTLVLEEIDPIAAEDLATESEDLEKRFGQGVQTRVIRLSFFTAKSEVVRQGLESLDERDFLGYAIYREDHVSKLRIKRVHESVLRFSRITHNYVRREPSWSAQVAGRKFRITGFLYAQQNGFTNVCAHAALRTMASAYHPRGDLTYRKINDLLGIDHVQNWVGEALDGSGNGVGLSMGNMLKVFDHVGARCIQADYSTPPNPKGTPPTLQIPYQHYLYGSIESGYPAAMVFDTSDDASKHVVPVFGHTFNRDLWVSNAERSYFQIGKETRFLPSDSWLSSFIMHDDNWGSNFCCPKHYLKPTDSHSGGRKTKESKADNREWLAHVIATLPSEIKMNPIHAEAIGLDFLSTLLPHMPPEDNEWAERLEQCVRDGLVVYRPILVSGFEYADHLAAVRGWRIRKRISPSLLQPLREALGDDPYWLVEMSLPELFASNLRKIGEVLLNPRLKPKPNRDFSSFVLARVPGHFALLGNRESDEPEFRFLPSGVDSHVSVFGRDD